MHPRDQMSTAFVYSEVDSLSSISPKTSGAMKLKVPARVRSAVSLDSTRLETPKSPILTHQSGAGLTTKIFYIVETVSVFRGRIEVMNHT
jgi:hypothetical protein